MTKIKAKVARIIDNRTLVLNKGTKDGVKIGMKFQILSPTLEQVIDPDTQKNLGMVSLPKVRVLVTQADDEFSVAETYEYTTINVGGALPNVAKIFEPPKLVKKYQTFEVEAPQSAQIEPEKSIVKVGDIAEELEIVG